jgi:DNA-binding NarL/FixJ family response regulator
MAAAERISAQLGMAARCTFVVSHEPGSTTDVDEALGETGASPVGHGTTAEEAGGSDSEFDSVVVVSGAVDSRSCKTVKALRSLRPSSTVVLVTRTAGRGSLAAALQAGASAVVLRATVATALGPALEAAAAGMVSIPQELATGVARPVLTAREKQILGMLVLGFTNGEIARKLHVAESTVKTHLSKVFQKLGVRSRNEAAAAILDPETGLGTGILAIPNEPVRAVDADQPKTAHESGRVA